MRQCLFLTTLYTFVSTSIACSGLNNKKQTTNAANGAASPSGQWDWIFESWSISFCGLFVLQSRFRFAASL